MNTSVWRLCKAKTPNNWLGLHSEVNIIKEININVFIVIMISSFSNQVDEFGVTQNTCIGLYF